ncbi:hypothetical protein LCGC14_1762600 [marine sediment metagenome]|uniref:Uncharacterized protein n=1 Tax=marine sediment metagenome TaxID=412755 RepID=A0A0F9K068_9ZZZZ
MSKPLRLWDEIKALGRKGAPKTAQSIGDDPKNGGLKDGYYEGPLDLFGEIT